MLTRLKLLQQKNSQMDADVIKHDLQPNVVG